MQLIDYETFRYTADGMIITMSLYSLLNYFKNKSFTFLLYSVTLLSGITEFFIIDQFYKTGSYYLATTTFIPEITCFNVILYCIFIIKTFEVHIQDKFIFKALLTVILMLIITILINVIFKTNNLEYLVPWVYGITIVSCTGLLVLVFRSLYYLSFSFMKYYLIGSVFITTGWVLKCIFQTYPFAVFEFIAFKYNNAFTFPNTYAQLGAIFESIFIFIAISESQKLLELSKIDLKKKILLSSEESINERKKFIEIKQKLLLQMNSTFNENLKNSLMIAEETLKTLAVGNREKAKENLLDINRLSQESIKIIRRIIRKFNEQNERIVNKSIESKVLEITKFHLVPDKRTFSLFVNESEQWNHIEYEFERKMLLFYEVVLKTFIQYKDFLHIMVSVSINNTGSICFIVQDDGHKVSSRFKMVRDLDYMIPELKTWNGKMIYYVENEMDSTVRIDFLQQ